MRIECLGGVAHGFLFGIFLVASIGKLVGCQKGSRIMCQKSLAEFVLAALCCLFLWRVPEYFISIVSIGIGVVGWGREIIQKSKVCNCFGVLSKILTPWQNYARAGLIAFGLILLYLLSFTNYLIEKNSADFFIGAFVGLTIVLVSLAYAISREITSGAKKAVSTEMIPVPPKQLMQNSVLGVWRNGSIVRLGDLTKANRPIVLLLSSDQCPQCQVIKNELQQLHRKTLLEFYIISEGELSQESVNDNVLFSETSEFRRSLGIKSIPSLIVVNPDTLKMMQPVALGVDAIRKDILRQLLA